MGELAGCRSYRDDRQACMGKGMSNCGSTATIDYSDRKELETIFAAPSVPKSELSRPDPPQRTVDP